MKRLKPGVIKGPTEFKGQFLVYVGLTCRQTIGLL